MDLYGQFFYAEEAGSPYRQEADLKADLLALLDAVLHGAFDCRNLWGERLAMRGVVITPEEFETALCERKIERRQGRESASLEFHEEFQKIRRHVESRIGASGDAFQGFRLIRAVRNCGLTEAEGLCFLLAAAVEWDRKYERLYGYLQDNVSAKLPTVGLGEALYFLGRCPEAEGNVREDQEKEDPDREDPDRETAGRIRENGPLWKLLLARVPKKITEESSLSRQMKLKEPVICWLRGEDCFSGRMASIIREREGNLTVDLEELFALEKEGGENPEEFLGSVVWMAGLRGRFEDTKLLLTGSRRIEWRKWNQALSFFESFGISCKRSGVFGKMEAGGGTVMLRPVFTWDDIILEETAARQLKQLCGRVKHKELVQKDWGFGKKSPYGHGISALFYGPPGTGKTMAAQVAASELGLNLCKVDLSGLVSKYIGETEKNLSRVFDEAAEADCILFFDEADGLFAKRSGVSDSNDRYANMETGYLLQKFEEYQGVCILATNCFYNMDDAFKRRITEIIRFSFPSAQTRKKLWKTMVPAAARVDEELELDYFASRFEMTGSAIKEVVTGAAYRAAMDGRGITNADVKDALKEYYMKYGKPLTAEELGESFGKD